MPVSAVAGCRLAESEAQGALASSSGTAERTAAVTAVTAGWLRALLRHHRQRHRRTRGHYRGSDRPRTLHRAARHAHRLDRPGELTTHPADISIAGRDRSICRPKKTAVSMASVLIAAGSTAQPTTATAQSGAG